MTPATALPLPLNRLQWLEALRHFRDAIKALNDCQNSLADLDQALGNPEFCISPDDIEMATAELGAGATARFWPHQRASEILESLVIAKKGEAR